MIKVPKPIRDKYENTIIENLRSSQRTIPKPVTQPSGFSILQFFSRQKPDQPSLDEKSYKKIGDKIIGYLKAQIESLNFAQKKGLKLINDSEDKLTRLLSIIESDSTKLNSFGETLKSILTPLNLDIKDLFGYENLLFPANEYGFNDSNRAILRRILDKYGGGNISASVNAEAQAKIQTVRQRLDRYIQDSIEDTLPNDNEKADETEVLKSFIEFIDNPSKAPVYGSFMHPSTKKSFYISPIHLELVAYLQSDNGFKPSEIAKNIDFFFPSQSKEDKDLWVRLLGKIKDPGDLSINISNFSAIPELDSLIKRTSKESHPMILQYLYHYSSHLDSNIRLSEEDNTFLERLPNGKTFITQWKKNKELSFELLKFFRDNPDFSSENLKKIDSHKLMSFKQLFNDPTKPDDQIRLYNIFSDLYKPVVSSLLPTRVEREFLGPLKDKLDDFSFVKKLYDQFNGQVNSRFILGQEQISLTDELIRATKRLVQKRSEIREKLCNAISSIEDTPEGVRYKTQTKTHFHDIFNHFWKQGILNPTPKQVVDYIKTLQGTHIGRRKFLAVAGAALLTGAGTTLGVNKYNEVQYQEYLAKDFNITNTAINDPNRLLFYENIFLQDLNKFLNSLKRENEQFNREAKETLFGEGNLDIPELIDLEPGSIIVANNFTRRDLSYSFKENDDGTVKIVSKSLRRFNPTSLNDALKEAFKDTPDIDPQTAINPLTNKTYYQSAEDFFKTSFEEFRLTDRVFCPYYAFINPNGKLRIIVEPETANLCFSPFKSVDNLINILPVNKEADRNNKFFKAYQKNLQTHFKMKELEVDRNISAELVPEYRALLERYGNRLDFDNPDQMNEYKDLLKKVDLKLEKKFNSFRTALKNQRDLASLIRILNMEWWYSLQNYSNMSNLSASSLVGNLSRSLASNRDQLQKLVLQHDNRPVSTTFSAIEEKLKNSDLVKFTIESLTEGIVPDDNGNVA